MIESMAVSGSVQSQPPVVTTIEGLRARLEEWERQHGRGEDGRCVCGWPSVSQPAVVTLVPSTASWTAHRDAAVLATLRDTLHGGDAPLSGRASPCEGHLGARPDEARPAGGTD